MSRAPPIAWGTLAPFKARWIAVTLSGSEGASSGRRGYSGCSATLGRFQSREADLVRAQSDRQCVCQIEQFAQGIASLLGSDTDPLGRGSRRVGDPGLRIRLPVASVFVRQGVEQ